MIHMTAILTGSAFYKKAGWPSWRAIRCRWQAFFSIFAFQIEKIMQNSDKSE